MSALVLIFAMAAVTPCLAWAARRQLRLERRQAALADAVAALRNSLLPISVAIGAPLLSVFERFARAAADAAKSMQTFAETMRKTEGR